MNKLSFSAASRMPSTSLLRPLFLRLWVPNLPLPPPILSINIRKHSSQLWPRRTPCSKLCAQKIRLFNLTFSRYRQLFRVRTTHPYKNIIFFQYLHNTRLEKWTRIGWLCSTTTGHVISYYKKPVISHINHSLRIPPEPVRIFLADALLLASNPSVLARVPRRLSIVLRSQ